ncbi:Protein sulfur deficiency-induced 1 [Vitis vinifera]|uniref:Protein sulfur deficiency-induced 1 n=1 Tax=Vitis vinifera TaxID=29760 RepID=A0A438G6Q7_VITVI|nr:Protein sulfur deficiency-induced 1 [Vitis vinifera]
MQESSRRGDKDPFCVIHKLPSGDAPYARAKRALLKMVEKDPEAAIVLFWNAINARDRVESALKDMAVVMKRLDRSEEAIEAIKNHLITSSSTYTKYAN